MKKKILLAAMAVFMMLAMTGCVSRNTQSKPSADLELPSGESSAVVELVDESDCEDTLDGLCKYLEGNYAVAGEKEQMSFDVIGADDGYKYSFNFGGSVVQVEVYEFDLEKLNDTGREMLDSIEKNGSMTVIENEVPAIISNNGKYVMVYTDSSDSEKSQEQQAKVEELFKNFKTS